MTEHALFAGADQITAPADWQQIGFISDTHCHEEDPSTLAGVLATLAQPEVDAWFLLGDLFEVWLGHDSLSDTAHFEARSTAQIRQALAGRPAFVLHGNRDFLMTPACAQAMGARLLSDPCVLQAFGQRWLLTHGDMACVDDRDYQRFRAMVRAQPWQQQFLSQPLSHRRELAKALRQQSQDSQKAQHAQNGHYSDVDDEFVRQSLLAHDSHHLIHGHTHRPIHVPCGPGERWVLSDWSASGLRGDWLRLDAQGLQRVPAVWTRPA